jgi:hypothetical protein
MSFTSDGDCARLNGNRVGPFGHIETATAKRQRTIRLRKGGYKSISSALLPSTTKLSLRLMG